MDDKSELYLQRAENELVVAQMLFQISSNTFLQKEQFLEPAKESLDNALIFFKNINAVLKKEKIISK